MSEAGPDLLFVYSLAQLAMSFCIYSFAGWVYEVVIGLFQHHRFINRGFSFGPVCPIYGAGAVLAIVVLAPLNDPLVQFVVGFFAAGVLEYTTSWAMEAIFHARWWDYSEYPLNLNGRVCALGLTVFSLLMLGVVYVSEPALKSLYVRVDPSVFVVVTGVLLVCLAVDFTASALNMLGFLDKLRGVQARMGDLSSRARATLLAHIQVVHEGIPDLLGSTFSLPEVVAGIAKAHRSPCGTEESRSPVLEGLPSIAELRAALASVVPGIRELGDEVVESLRDYADPQVRGELADKFKDVWERGWSRYERKTLRDPWFRVTQGDEALEWARRVLPPRTHRADKVHGRRDDGLAKETVGDGEAADDGQRGPLDGLY